MEGNQETTALAVRGPGAVFSFAPRNIDEAARFCDALAKSDLVPKEFRQKPANVMLAVQMGAELGLQPMQAIQSIAVINGRPSMWGDGLLGVVEASGLLEDFEETYDEATKTATCSVLRRGRKRPTVRSFSWMEAESVVTYSWDNGTRKASKLTDKDTYKSYPKRMLQMRARTFALRDTFSDVLRGLTSREEAADLPVLEIEGGGSVRVVEESPLMPRRAGESATPAAAAAAATPTPEAPSAAPVVDAEVVEPKAASSATSRSDLAATQEITKPHEQSDGSSAAWGPYLVPKYSTEGSEQWQGLIVDVKDPLSNDSRRYILVGQDARKFGTFSKSLTDAARAFLGKAEPLRITFDESEFGRDIRTLQARPGVASPTPAAPAAEPTKRARKAPASEPAAPTAPAASAAPAPATPEPSQIPAEAFDEDVPPAPVLLSNEQKAEIVGLFNRHGKTPAAVKPYLKASFGIDKLADLPAVHVDTVREWAKK